MRVALDSNFLAYAEGINGVARRAPALDLLQRLPPDTVLIPVQALGELFNVLVRKGGKSRTYAREALLGWRDSFAVIETSSAILLSAADLATDHELGIWDAIILAAASQAACRLLLSEDLREGFTWGGVTVVNPFASTPHVLLRTLLEDPAG